MTDIIPEAETLTELLADEATTLADGAVTDLFEEGHDLLDSETDGELASAGHKALSLIEAHKDPFLRLTKVGFARVVAHFGSGDEEAARNAYMEFRATYKERRAYMQKAGDELYDDAKERREAWDGVLAVLKQVGIIGIKFLVKAATVALLA